MQGGRGGKHPVVCEVCPDRVGHNEVIVVGRRVTGYPRVIHDRHSCKRKWERNKEEIMKKWQRSDTPTPALEKFAVKAAALLEPSKTVKGVATMEYVPTNKEIDAVVGPIAEAVVQTKTRKVRHLWKPKQELVAVVDGWIKENGFIPRTTVNKLITVIHYNHPALLVDMTGTTFTDQALGEFIRSRSIPAAPVVATAGEREAAQMAEVARRRSRAAVLAQAIIASVMVLLVNDDLETLETLHELARK